MKRNQLLGGVVAAAISVLATGELLAQATTAGLDPALAARQQELAAIKADRSRVIQEIVDQWKSQLRPAIPSENVGGDEAEITSALRSASPGLLLAASRAQSYEQLMALLPSRQGPSVIPLEPGEAIPNTLGSASNDLVFTPVTPCRIIDTRLATGAGLAGRIGPNDGKQFSVSLTNYATQGGNAGSCGIPIAPAAVAINVTSTDQTGPGNLRVIQTGGGVPNVSLLNYTAGVNVANAAVVRSAGSLGFANIYIYSGNSTSQAVVDIMGYYAAPVATALDQDVLVTSTGVTAGFQSVYSPTCTAGWRLVGGGCLTGSFTDNQFIGSRPVVGGSNSVVSGVNSADAWLCQVNATTSTTIYAFAVCAQVPGR